MLFRVLKKPIQLGFFRRTRFDTDEFAHPDCAALCSTHPCFEGEFVHLCFEGATIHLCFEGALSIYVLKERLSIPTMKEHPWAKPSPI